MKKKISRNEKEKLDNRVVFLTSATLLYGLLLLFIQKMAQSSMTVNGAIAFIQIMRWVSVASAMACAAWSAYKEKKEFFMYCGVSIFVFLSTTALLYCGKHGKAFLINYLALFIIFVLTQVYYLLKSNSKFDLNKVRYSFVIVSVLMFIGVCAVSVLQIIR